MSPPRILIIAMKQLIRNIGRDRRGFTLSELVIVIVILSVVTGTVSISVDQLNQDTRLSNALARALSDLRHAQEMAMTHRREVDFYVTPESDSYYAQWHDTGDYLVSPVDGGDLSVAFNTGEYSDVEITSTGLSSRLSFSSTGEPFIGGARFNGGVSVMQLNSGYYISVYSSGLTTYEEAVGGGGCAGSC